MSRLIIHVGTHKTATTHVQDTFYKNRALLKKHGVVYPKIGQTRGQHGLASAWIRMPAPYALRDPGRAWAQLNKVHAGRKHTVFLSSEEFSRLNPVRVDMTALARLTSGFDEVRILCTLRNQASFLQSVYQQISDERQPAPWIDLIRRALRHGVIDGLAADYNILYNHLLTGFSPEQIRFISFDEAAQKKGSILGSFLHELDLKINEDQLEPFGTSRSNVSPPPLATLIANEMSKPGVARAGLVKKISNCLSSILPHEARTTIFSRSEMKQVQEIFAPLNRRLLDRISPHQPGFELSETPANAKHLLFRDQLDPSFWIGMLRQLDQ